jgi:signal transduction histidine kinase
MVAVLLVGGTASAAGGSAPSDVITLLVVVVIAAFAIGRHLDAPARWWVAGALGLGVGLIDVVDYGPSAVIFPLLLCAICAGVGGLLRDRATMTRRLAEQVHELDALREAGARDAVLDERRRIARELHDVVAHTVSVMVIQAAGARRQLDRDHERAVAALRQVRVTGEDTLVELDRLFGLLHAAPDAGAAPGLASVDSLVERTRAAGLPVELEVTGTPARLDPDADLAAYRVVQEALTNTLKHAGPATARVAIAWSAGAVQLCVTDTGHGATRGDGSRRGLVGMRERVELFGGEVQAGPRRDGGFEVWAQLPLARQEVAA